MDKKGFIDFLTTKLDYLVENEKNKEITKYTSFIDNFINMGQSEVDAVKSLGDPNDLVTAIYLSHGLDVKKLFGDNYSGKGIKAAFKNFYKTLTGQDRKKSRNALIYMIYLVLLCVIIKVLFIFVRDELSSMFGFINSSKIGDKIYYITFELLYILTAVLIFIKSMKKRFN